MVPWYLIMESSFYEVLGSPCEPNSDPFAGLQIKSISSLEIVYHCVSLLNQYTKLRMYLNGSISMVINESLHSRLMRELAASATRQLPRDKIVTLICLYYKLL